MAGLDSLKAAVDALDVKVNAAVTELDALAALVKAGPPATSDAELQALADRITAIGAGLQAAEDRDAPPA